MPRTPLSPPRLARSCATASRQMRAPLATAPFTRRARIRARAIHLVLPSPPHPLAAARPARRRCIGAEMVTESPRSTVMGVAAAFNWIFTTVVGLAFGPMQTALGNYSFLPFCVCLLLTFIFVVWAVPETKGDAAPGWRRTLPQSVGSVCSSVAQ